MFVWASIAHVATPLGAAGVSTLPSETAVVSELEKDVGERAGLYLFPAMGSGANTQPVGPVGFLVWRPHVVRSLDPANLGSEFASELAQALIAAVLLSMAAVSGFVPRVGFVLLLGIAAAITTNVSYWNWYGFPTNYTLPYALIELVGYAVAGVVIASILPKRAATTTR
jgi:mannose/fructose/N-acetylgalactosamine-specific phosphotransferase system component IIC